MVVENPEAAADNGLAVAGGIPGQSNSGTYILVIARNAFHNAEGLLRGGIHRGCWREEGADFHVISNTVIDGEVIVQNPVVLREEAHGDIVEGIVRISDSLDVRSRNSQAIAVQASRSWQRNFTRNPRPTMAATRPITIMHSITRDC